MKPILTLCILFFMIFTSTSHGSNYGMKNNQNENIFIPIYKQINDEDEFPTDSEMFENSPIIKAALNGDWKKVKKLLNNGAYISDTDFDGLTPLHHAALHGDDNAVLMLLELGADIHAKAVSDIRPYDMARENPNISPAVRELLNPDK